MLIGILQTGYAPDALRAQGDYPDMFQRLLELHNFDFGTWRVVDNEFPESVNAASGWLITGSKHGVYEDHAFIAPLEQFVRDAFAARVPVVGICFGHQIMAQALGGKVEKFSGGWAVGPTEYQVGDERMTLNAWHQDQVVAPPPDAEVIATTPFCPYAGFRYEDRGFSIQPHPEFTDEFLLRLIDARGRGLVPDPLLDDAKAKLGGRNDAARIAQQIADFFKRHRA